MGKFIVLLTALCGLTSFVASPAFAASVTVSTEAKLPNATVSRLPAFTLTKDFDHDGDGEGGYMCWDGSLSDGTLDRPLNIVMNFIANETAEEAEANGYGDWICDFYLTFTGLADNASTNSDGKKYITADANSYLAGYYGDFGWIVIPAEGLNLVDGEVYPVVSAYDAKLTYYNICDYVQKFTAAIHISDAILKANPNMQVRLQLKMKNPENSADEIVVGSYTYDVADIKGTAAPTVDNPTVKAALAPAYKATGGKLAVTVSTEAENTYEITAPGYEMPEEGLEMSLPAPAGIANTKTAFVVHTHDTKKYIYAATVENGFVTFTNTLGFSDFTVGDESALNAALAAGGEIVLLSDIETSSTLTIPEDVTVTLDMNGKKITATDTKVDQNANTGCYELFYIYGELTVTGNGTIELTATTDRDWNASSSIFLNRGGVLTIKNGTFTHKGGSDMAFVVDNSGNHFGDATTIINGGTIHSSYTAIRNRMEQNSHGASGKTYLTITAGSVTGGTSAIWAQAATTSETSPATGEITISGGTIGAVNTARSDGAECMTTISGGTVANFKGEVGELTVTGDGTVSAVEILNADGTAADYVITGEGVYAPVVAKIGDKKYASLQDAIAAATADQTITLLADVELTESVVISGKAITLDLGDNDVLDKSTTVLTSSNDVWGLIDVKNSAKLTVTGTGTIKCDYKVVSGGWTGMAYCINVDATSELVVEGGTFINGNGGIQTHGKVTVNDGTFVSHNGGTCIMAVYSNANVSVNGGTFRDSVEESDDYTGSGAVWGGFGATIAITGGTFDFAADPSNNNIVWTLFPAQNAIAGQGENANMTVSGGTFVNFNPETDVVIDYSASTKKFTFGSVVAEGYAALQNLDGNYVVGEKPTATVNNLGAMTIPESDYIVYNGSKSGDMPLNFVMQFLADQDAEDMETSPYADWYADFVLTFEGLPSGSFTADGCYLAGYYGDFGWVKVPVDGMTIEEDARYPVMLGVGMGQKYDYICESVKDFRCAMYLTDEILEANPNIKVKLELSIVDNSKGEDEALNALAATTLEYVNVVGETEYTADNFAGLVAQIGEVKYATLQAAIEAAAKTGDTITLLGDIALTDTVKIDGKSIILDLNGKTVSGVCDGSEDSLIYIENTAALTVKDSATGGKLTYAGSKSTGYAVDVEGALTLESGTIELTGSWAIGFAVDVRPNSWGTEYTNPSIFTMNGGNIVSSDGAVRVASSSDSDHKAVSASFVMNGGTIEAAWDGVFIQQSNATYDKLTFTMNDGTIESDINPIRVYGPAPTGYVNGQDCMNITLNGGTCTYTGTETYEWVIDGILRADGGSSAKTIVENGGVSMSVDFATSAVNEAKIVAKTGGGEVIGQKAAEAAKVLGGTFELVSDPDGDRLVYDYELGIASIDLTQKTEELAASNEEETVYTLDIDLGFTEDGEPVTNRDMTGRRIVYTITSTDGTVTKTDTKTVDLTTWTGSAPIEVTESELGAYVGSSRSVKISFKIEEFNSVN